MKQIITIFSLAAILTACNNTSEKPIAGDSKMSTVSDTSDYAAFQAWKKQKEEAGLQSSQEKASKPTVVYVHQPAPVRTNKSVAQQPQPADQSVPTTSTTPTIPASTPQQVTKKKMSTATKGAIIGAGSGAIAGAIIGRKNPWLGALIGGVAGGGVGYGVGTTIEKK